MILRNAFIQTVKAVLLFVFLGVGFADARGAISGTGSPVLVIQTHSVPRGEVGQPYTSTLLATGGKPGYTWMIAAGNLPQGLALSKSGQLSGIPAKSGIYLVDLAVTDVSQPQKRASEYLFVTVSAAAATTPRLTINPSTLPSGVVGQPYAFAAQATGGTGSYTWSIAGNLPAGLSLTSNTGAIAGTPTMAATSSFSLTVRDTSAQTQTVIDTISIVAAPTAAAPPTGPATWYVRQDGGTRYSANVPTGQCDGLGDGPYSGKGVNQHCAFNDVRLLWQDGSYAFSSSSFPAAGWVGKGGDTYIVRGSIAAGTKPYRIGWDPGSNNGISPLYAAGALRGWIGDPQGSGSLSPPSGTASQPTRILGENFANCTSQSARTPVNGGQNVGTAWNFSTSYVDFECFDLSDNAQGYGADAATAGIGLQNTADHLTLKNVRMHGFTTFGMYGPSGNGSVFDHVAWIGNGGGGWNADVGNGKTGTGSLLVTNYEILWNGCFEEYPLVDALPYVGCKDQSHGGYGDGFGTATVTAPAPGWQVRFDQGTVAYNTQDGLDALHLIGGGSSMTITRTLAYGNMGQQIKNGGSAGTVDDNVIVGNCSAMANAIPGTPAGYNANLSDFCRAGNQPVLLTVGHNATTQFRHNTVLGNGALLISYTCDNTAGPCDSTASLDVRDNILLGNPDPTRGNPGANYIIVGDDTYTSAAACNTAPDGHHYWTTDGFTGCNNNVFFNPGSFNSHNVYFNVKDSCSANNGTGNLCMDPGLVDEIEPAYGYPNLALSSSGGAAFQGGIALPDLSVDYTGTSFHNPPTIGALEQGITLKLYVAEQ